MNVSPNRQFAVVTGASSGIGYELARQFGQHGFDFLVVSEQRPFMMRRALSKKRAHRSKA